MSDSKEYRCSTCGHTTQTSSPPSEHVHRIIGDYCGIYTEVDQLRTWKKWHPEMEKIRDMHATLSPEDQMCVEYAMDRLNSALLRLDATLALRKQNDASTRTRPDDE